MTVDDLRQQIQIAWNYAADPTKTLADRDEAARSIPALQKQLLKQLHPTLFNIIYS